MAGWLDLATVAPGTPVFGADGTPLGAVEAVEGQNLYVGGRAIPAEAIARVEPAGLFLHLTRAALEAGPPSAAPDVSEPGAASAAAATEGDRLVITLADERPVVTAREVDQGEIIIIKRVIEEERLVPVRLRREVLERVRRNPDGTETIEDTQITNA
ncbi:MAG TPA: DUF2382 domain-containing protein [Thermomicrobiales bacterium]|jgi:hypothetical protein